VCYIVLRLIRKNLPTTTFEYNDGIEQNVEIKLQSQTRLACDIKSTVKLTALLILVRHSCPTHRFNVRYSYRTRNRTCLWSCGCGYMTFTGRWRTAEPDEIVILFLPAYIADISLSLSQRHCTCAEIWYR